jgi:hypothetical protein
VRSVAAVVEPAGRVAAVIGLAEVKQVAPHLLKLLLQLQDLRRSHKVAPNENNLLNATPKVM